ncbi:putative alpha mannosyltransferase protein [Coleophoma crateriformis]|uniref:Putative alpha mannosyltransferase protein n=1 Tax=Coleophoma crateriformis TaxID=565419 RepID=A0A3D8SNI8_9HELO|nr:putative alpha mannosyltransferase protein [Coleophoma crateriformis]
MKQLHPKLTTLQLRVLGLSSVVLLVFFALLFEFDALALRPLFRAPKPFSIATSAWPARPIPANLVANSTAEFWEYLAPLLAAAGPRCEKPTLADKAQARIREGPHPVDLRNLIEMDKDDVEHMRRSHAWYVQQISQQTPPLFYREGTRGIVTSAGASYFPPLLVSLQFLRRTGSQLPVEVFLTSEDEYEPLMCEAILPSLNARCIVLSLKLDEYILPFKFTKYQLKIFAMLFSSFEELLFLDADNFPVENPDEIFVEEPYISQHMVLWPDYWNPTVSPYLNTVIGLDKDVLTNRPTIEAGQILVSKPHHAKTLLLAAYYNAYGDFYYHLMTQGGPGEGDKETFATAALALGIPFYDIKQMARPLGDRSDGGAVVQTHPLSDFNRTQDGDPRPLFIHASWPPKLNALHNYQNRRQWGSEENSRALFNGQDMEEIAWGYMVDMACNDKVQFLEWGNKFEHGICDRTKKSYSDMFKKEYEFNR